MSNAKRGDQWVKESVHAESLSELEVPHSMSQVLVHGDAAPGSPRCCILPGYAFATVTCNKGTCSILP